MILPLQDAREARFRNERGRAELIRVGTVSSIDTSGDRKLYTVLVGNGAESIQMVMIDSGVTIVQGDVVAFITGPRPLGLGRIELS